MQKNKIYILDTCIFDDLDKYNYWYNLVSKERKEKIDKYIFEKDKKLSLGAWILLYHGLKSFDLIDSKIIYNEKGKPYLKNKKVFFNISHSSNLVVCVFSDKEIGVDLEKNTKFQDVLIKRIFNKDEIKYIEGSHNDKNELYTRLWTIKESITKYLGDGITIDLRDILFDLENNKCIKFDKVDIKKIFIKNYILDGYSLSICSEYKNYDSELEWFWG